MVYTMSFLRVLLGILIGGLISTGAIIGSFYAGTLVAWWLVLVLAGVGCLIGGLVAGLISQGPGKGILAGVLSGIIVFGGTYLFFWLVLGPKIEAWFTGDLNSIITGFLTYIGVEEGTQRGDTAYYAQHRSDKPAF